MIICDLSPDYKYKYYNAQKFQSYYVNRTFQHLMYFITILCFLFLFESKGNSSMLNVLF